MKKLLLKTGCFFVPLLLIIAIALCLPVTPRASKSLLISAIKKDSLLQFVPSPRMIFVGGSSLSFGLNSKVIKDSLNVNVINTAIQADIGLKFMMNNTLQYVKKDDIVILAPEYSHYFHDINAGSEELLRMVFDVNLSNLKLLNFRQILNVLPYLPKYALTKYKVNEYINVKESDIYSVNSFNEFGDVSAHWNLKPRPFAPLDPINKSFNYAALKEIVRFENAVKKRGGSLYITFPGLQSTSFNNLIRDIVKVENELKKTDITVLGTAERYKFPDTMMFNTPYHLAKAGVDCRTRYLIEDFKSNEIFRQNEL